MFDNSPSLQAGPKLAKKMPHKGQPHYLGPSQSPWTFSSWDGHRGQCVGADLKPDLTRYGLTTPRAEVEAPCRFGPDDPSL